MVHHSEVVAEIFGIYVRTLQRWIYRYENDQTLERRQRKAISYKLRKVHLNTSLKLINKYPSISIQTLWKFVKQKHDDFDITPQHLGSVVRDNNITRKRTTKRHFPDTRYGKKLDLKKELKLFYSVIDSFPLNKIISLDEISVHAMMKPNYSRCELGKRCVMKTTNNKVFTKYTILASISSNGVIGWTMYEKCGMTGERLVSFLNTFVLGKYKNHLIILDNAGSHRNKNVKIAINNSGNTIHYSVPYRPKTNAIETWFSQFKHHFIQEQGKTITFGGLKKIVRKVINKIEKHHYKNIMTYAYKSPSTRKIRQNQSTRRRNPKKYKP